MSRRASSAPTSAWAPRTTTPAPRGRPSTSFTRLPSRTPSASPVAARSSSSAPSSDASRRFVFYISHPLLQCTGRLHSPEEGCEADEPCERHAASDALTHSDADPASHGAQRDAHSPPKAGFAAVPAPTAPHLRPGRRKQVQRKGGYGQRVAGPGRIQPTHVRRCVGAHSLRASLAVSLARPRGRPRPRPRGLVCRNVSMLCTRLSRGATELEMNPAVLRAGRVPP